jgi:hypothetical protein
MAGWGDVAVGAGKIAGGLRQMGICGEVHVHISTEDGEGLEKAFSRQATFKSATLPHGPIIRMFTLTGVNFRWYDRVANQT